MTIELLKSKSDTNKIVNYIEYCNKLTTLIGHRGINDCVSLGLSLTQDAR